MKYTNIFGDSELSGFSPDGLGDYYKITDAQLDHNYWQEKIVSALQCISNAHTTDCQIIYGGDVTDGGSGTVDISAGMALGKDSAGNIRLVTVPALTGISLPSGWNDDRQIWVIGQYESSLDTPTRTHKLATPDTYHYVLEDNYTGNADSDDLFVDSDPNTVSDTIVCWGSFKMNGTTFSAETGRTDSMGLSLQDTTINQYGIGVNGVVADADYALNVSGNGNLMTTSGVQNVFRQLQSGVASSQIGSKASDNNFYLTNTYNGNLGDATKSIIIDRDGYVGIGVIAPSPYKLNIDGDFKAQDTTINQYGIGVNGAIADANAALNVTGNADISGDLEAQDTTINQYGIGVNGATATTVLALNVTGSIKSSKGRWPTGYMHIAATTEGDLFDELTDFIPFNGDTMIVTGSIYYSSDTYICSRVLRITSTTIYVYYADVNTVGYLSLTSGDSTVLFGVSLAW